MTRIVKILKGYQRWVEEFEAKAIEMQKQTLARLNQLPPVNEASILIDWKNPENYSHLENEKSSVLWAWEFLRRNKEYQDDWLELVTHGDIETEDIKTDCLPSNICDLLIKSPNSAIIDSSGKLTKKWGIIPLPNPQNHNPDVLTFCLDSGVELQRMCFEESAAKLVGLDCATYVKNNQNTEPTQSTKQYTIDLSQSLAPQMKFIKEDAKGMQDYLKSRRRISVENKRVRQDLHLEYLRIWDANRTKESYPDIAEIIFPELENSYENKNGSERVRDSFKAASALVNKGYNSILRKGVGNNGEL